MGLCIRHRCTREDLGICSSSPSSVSTVSLWLLLSCHSAVNLCVPGQCCSFSPVPQPCVPDARSQRGTVAVTANREQPLLCSFTKEGVLLIPFRVKCRKLGVRCIIACMLVSELCLCLSIRKWWHFILLNIFSLDCISYSMHLEWLFFFLSCRSGRPTFFTAVFNTFTPAIKQSWINNLQMAKLALGNS